jgi:hypothetical protein
MTLPLIMGLMALAVLTVHFVVAMRTWLRVRGARIVVCPETERPVAVRVDVGHAMATAIREKPDLKLTSCTRWPERQDCDQPCVQQIETAPSETDPRTIAARFFGKAHCAICARRIETPSAIAPQPGFMDPASHKAERWDEIPPQDLPSAIATRRPLCSNCTVAETFRQRFPDRVTDRRPH